MTKLNECALIEPFMVDANDSVVEVAKHLRDSILRQVFVVDSEKKPLGLISTTDMNNRVCAEGKDPTSLKASDIMSSPIELCTMDDDAQKIYKDMTSKKRMLCAVIDEKGCMKGMITIGELLKGITGSH